MSEAKQLLEQATTPLPWVDRGIVAHSLGKSNAALAVYAVNRLPDYEAAVEALERFLGLFDASVVDESAEGLWDGHDAATAALARLRESEPANVR